ncbi:MAG: biotin--[acetyl-CoA-carboxylase] ligase [Thermodesulfobacteria bacterium]|nr:biotin--[acetyl-CoA-carboxylase] ligase [Thermodesulfobacteriota bacterium]
MKRGLAKEKILDLLNSSKNPLSGEFIAKKLGISRTAVWKNIQNLKKAGFNIITTSKGYFLKDNDELSSEDFKELGILTICLKEVPSTMDVAKQKMENEADEVLVIAEKQTQGRGRLGRQWISQEGGAWFSLGIRPKVTLKECFIFTYIAGLAVIKAILDVTGIQTFLKWPNDVIYKKGKEEKKLAGILLEVKGEVDVVNYIIVGIGINVNNAISFLEPQAISIKDILKYPISRKKIIKSVVKNFFQLNELSFSEVLKLWKKNSITLGRSVKIIQPNQEVIGLALDISEDGALIVQSPEMSIHKVFSGDCIHAKIF